MNELNAFSVLVTENCNLACKYCYEITNGGMGHNKNRMTEEIARDSVHFMFDHAKQSPDIAVSFFGGEPTLAPDIIDIMCTTGKELSKKHDKPFFASMITNATIMNENLYGVLKKHRDIWQSTQLSIDGPEEIQDEYRVTKGGDGSFALIKKALPYWKALYGKNLNIHGVLNKKSIPKLFDSYLYFRHVWKEDALWWIPAKSTEYDDEDFIAYDQQLGKITQYILQRVRRERDVREINYYAPLNRALNDKHERGKPCGAGMNYCAITAKGEIWPCHHFYFIDKKREMYMGNIYDGVDLARKRIWDAYDDSDMRGCDGCPQTSCFRCPAENFEENGSPFSQIKGSHCRFMMIDYKYQEIIREQLNIMGLRS